MMPGLDNYLERIHPAVLYLLVAFVSVLALVPVWLNYDIISMDGAFQYIPYARLLVEGDLAGALQLKQLPVYPGLIALTVFLTGASFELAGRLVAATCFVLLMLGVWRLTLLLFQRRATALVAVLLALCIPELLNRSVDCLKESLLLALIVWGNVFVFSAQENLGASRYLRIMAGGLILILAVLVRTTALFFIAAWVFVWLLKDERRRWQRLAAVAIPLLGLMIMAYIFRESAIFQRKGFAIFYVLELFPGWRAALNGFIAAGVKFLLTGNPLVMILAFAGLSLMDRRVYRLNSVGVLILFGAVIVLLGWASDRYLLAPVIWLLPAGAWAIVKALESKVRWQQVLAVIAIISCPVLWGVQATKAPDMQKLVRKEAGLWVSKVAGTDREIVSNVPRLVFYAQGRVVPVGEDIKGRIVALDLGRPGAQVWLQETGLANREASATFDSVRIYLPTEIPE